APIARTVWGVDLRASHLRHYRSGRSPQSSAVPHHSPILDARVLHARPPAPGAGDMVLIRDLSIQGVQMLLVLLVAPLFTGFVRKVKARLLQRQGPSLVQPYFDLVRLMRTPPAHS